MTYKEAVQRIGLPSGGGPALSQVWQNQRGPSGIEFVQRKNPLVRFRCFLFFPVGRLACCACERSAVAAGSPYEIPRQCTQCGTPTPLPFVMQPAFALRIARVLLKTLAVRGRPAI
jgi:hypothetical protein